MPDEALSGTRCRRRWTGALPMESPALTPARERGDPRVIPGERSEGRGPMAPSVWVDSLPLRWLRHLRPGMTPSFMPSHSRHHRPRAGDPDTVKREVTHCHPGARSESGIHNRQWRRKRCEVDHPLRGCRGYGSRALLRSPGMTAEMDGEQRYVLTLFLTTVPTSAIPLPRSAPDEGRAREASQCGSRHGPVHVPYAGACDGRPRLCAAE